MGQESKAHDCFKTKKQIAAHDAVSASGFFSSLALSYRDTPDRLIRGIFCCFIGKNLLH